jgi:hypothetical protein
LAYLSLEVVDMLRRNRHPLYGAPVRSVLRAAVVGVVLLSCWQMAQADELRWWPKVKEDQQTPRYDAGLSGRPPDIKLQVPFAVKDHGYLFVRFGSTRKAGGNGLILVTKRGAAPVRRLSDLQGHVTISNEKEALAFARLLTSPVTAAVWYKDDVEREMTTLSAIDSLFCYGDAAQLQGLKMLGGKGADGIVATREELAKHGVRPATVAKASGGYTISRTLLQLDLRGERLIKVVEFVGKHGEYRRTSSRARPIPDRLWYIFREED